MNKKDFFKRLFSMPRVYDSFVKTDHFTKRMTERNIREIAVRETIRKGKIRVSRSGSIFFYDTDITVVFSPSEIDTSFSLITCFSNKQ